MFFELNKKDYGIIVVVLAFCISITILLYYFVFNAKNSNTIKRKGTNEYVSKYITNDKQASIYLGRYYYLLNNNTSEAYKLLDKESLNRFYDENIFKEYINTINISNSKVLKLNYYSKNNYVYYDVIDTNNNNFVFKTKGVMDYTVIIK